MCIWTLKHVMPLLLLLLQIPQAKAVSAAAEKIQEEVEQLKRLKGRLADMAAAAARASLPLTPGGQVDFAQDFFGEKVFLTVSGQLNGECSTPQ
jgi:hypothetical protein